MNHDHLNALRLRLSHLRCMPASPLRDVWIAQSEREVIGEEQFLAVAGLTDDEILAELGGDQ